MEGTKSAGLIFDLGMHRGEDTEFYLAKGFRVVAVDANAKLCEMVGERLATQVESGQLTIVNAAIADTPGTVTFYADDNSAWGTIDRAWAGRNRRLGSEQEERSVVATTSAALVEKYGVPYFVKIDIEGLDVTALSGLAGARERPQFVSIESDKVSFRALRTEFEILTDLGYNAFKVVSQTRVPDQRLPNPAREGRYVAHRFEFGSSGAFGEEAPGDWMSAAEAIDRYRRVFVGYAVAGDDPLVRTRLVQNAIKAVTGIRYDWFDTHARR